MVAGTQLRYNSHVFRLSKLPPFPQIMRILVTGATGFLGNHVVRSLLADGHEITAAVRHSSDPRPLSGWRLERLELDLTNINAISRAVNEVDLIIHAAALIHVGWTQLEASRKINVESTRLLATAARRKNIRMVHISSVDTLAAAKPNAIADETHLEPAKPLCSYVVSKREAEQVVLSEIAQGLDGVIVNPGFMVGPADWKPSSGKMMLMLAKQPVLFFAPAGGCCVVDVRDVAAGIVSAIERGRTGERYILGGENLSYLALWQRMAKVMQRRPPVRAMSNTLASVVGRCGDLASRLLRQEFDVNSAATQFGQMFHWYSSQKSQQELGYHINNVDDALSDAWDWFKNHDYV